MNYQDSFFVIYYTITLQSVLLGHLSKENNYEELAYETVRLEVTLVSHPLGFCPSDLQPDSLTQVLVSVKYPNSTSTSLIW